jgi:transcriptional regulator of acetoin/glycerol metabolism
MAGAATTQPSAHTDFDGGRGRPRAVRWVYPTPLVTPLQGQRVVGRDESCDTVLAGNEISRRHAEFRVDGPIAAVRDLQSRNGVFVNGAKRADAPLAPGDVVRCGEWIGVVAEAAGDGDGFREIAAGWFGGATLAAATEPARRLTAELPVVVQGETGTGKEGVARAIHTWSGRSGPFVPVNCAALPGELAEAELFGYRKGAFTGAEVASAGLFRAAHGGSLFLDEILDLPAALQPKLLRVLEDRQVRGLGETKQTTVDVRIIAATQEPLAEAVAERRFRADLQARLEGLTVVLPPLRARREDVTPLFLEFLRQHCGGQPPALEPKLVETLCLYDWPLNVRELSLLARRLLGVQGHEPVLRKSFLPERMLRRAPDSQPPAPASGKQPRRSTDDEAEFEALIEALRRHGGSVAKAATAMGLSRARAYRLLSAHPDFSVDDLRG